MAADNRYDLRSGTRDHRRALDKQHKWCHNFTNNQRPTPQARPQGKGGSQRPVRPWAREAASKPAVHGKSGGYVGPWGYGDPKLRQKRAVLSSVEANRTESLIEAYGGYESDNVTESDIAEDEQPSDVYTQIGTGEAMLVQALKTAENKFEDKQTTKLVKDEYDVVEDGADEGPGSESVEDDFEML